ncbi:MAG: hypothetical protein K0Q79_2956 [Flavipsychrobacter sp.]|jgi:hypothetical protein|nr:hypothetical protein [Flavipsychrobacter sp.]
MTNKNRKRAQKPAKGARKKPDIPEAPKKENDDFGGNHKHPGHDHDIQGGEHTDNTDSGNGSFR